MLEFRLLGPVEVWADSGRVALGRAESAKTRCMLAVLLRTPGVLVSTDALIERVWGEHPPGSAVRYKYIGWLRSALAPYGVSLDHRDAGYALDVDAEQVDLHRFRRLTGQARNADEPDKACRMLDEALGLWRGAALAGLPGTWNELFRSQLERERRAARILQARCALKSGAIAQALEWLDEWEAEYPTDEEIIGLRVTALHRSGQHADAQASYLRACQRLRDMLGVSPGSELLALHRHLQDRHAETDVVAEALADLAVGSAGEAAVGSADGEHKPGRLVPRQLPAPVSGFTAREQELADLDRLLDHGGPGQSRARTQVLSGMPGIGKTALATYWAHRVAHRFPDGQLHVDLRGYDPGEQALTPEDVLRGFLEALGSDPRRVPAEPTALVGIYRSLLAERRMLIVLDNARSAEQVRPLLPGSSGCVTLVTSRSQLTGLIASEAACLLTLAPLTEGEARTLLADRLGEHRIAAEPRAVQEITIRCDGLPLALAVIAAHAAACPRLPLAELVAELRDAQGVLGNSPAADAATDIRAVFFSSYRHLSPGAATVFRLLSLHPGPDASVMAAASLAALSPDEVRPLLAELTCVSLLTRGGSGRYTCHDLLRAYAADLAARHDDEAARRAAVRRMLDHYLCIACNADQMLDYYRDALPLPSADDGVTVEELSDQHLALRWLAAECPVLNAVVHLAFQAGFDEHAWKLGWCLARFLERQAQWHLWSVTLTVALDAATRLADQEGQARIHCRLGWGNASIDRLADAHTHSLWAWDLYLELGDRSGQARATLNLAQIYLAAEDKKSALGHAESALDLCRQTGDPIWEARALNCVGWCHAMLGEHRQALLICEKALTFQQDSTDGYGAAFTLDSLGYVHHLRAEYPRAVDRYLEAIGLWRQFGDCANEAITLDRLGDAHRSVGAVGAARDAWSRALSILDDISQEQADRIRAKLETLGSGSGQGKSRLAYLA
jgi:tetratricopeptide (TPR) repeat protein